MELLTWEVIAKQLGCGESTLRKYNTEQEPRWQKAVEEAVAEMRRDALPTGYGCLLHAARFGDVTAAKELLNRAEGPVTQKTGHSGNLSVSWWDTLDAARARGEEPDGSTTDSTDA
jgi:hypothetical protein